MKKRKQTLRPMLVGSALLFTPLLVDRANADDTQPSNEIQSTVTETKATQAELGISVSPLPPVLTSHLPEVIGKGRGVLVSDVRHGSPAEKAGLRMNDVLIRYDDQDLYSPEQLVKRVRNDEPGKEIELEFVRAGKLNTVKVTLGEKPIVVPIENNWPGFTRRFDVPLPSRPDFLTEDEDLLGDGNEWTHFESISVVKDEDGTYRAKVTYKDENGASIDREYTGTRQEVRDAINHDKELPEDQRNQLLRTLDDRGAGTFPSFKFPSVPNWTPWRQPWNQEWFHWPNMTF
ncbi:putative periplasmic serine endoprotease DegP-like precursor [Novipirellula aureliae]|uniref:Putative periplasmic serine endoprotease DegP-like n=1 Tax=Novipirellula aureliae TaxID=2527966 RepID=A0A5C6E7P9_9BACT|nr:PDZ domain-containing protein [Novipirellula aureliae]TWU43496.1 putative periplasmic serine endoprotease DegP-like precursor [Novipirellula aureliae]